MIRTLLQWEITRRLDEGRPLGKLLMWLVEHDPQTKMFHRTLLELAPRLQADAAVLLERNVMERKRTPLRIVSRSLAFAVPKSSGRWKSLTAAVLLAVSLTFLGSMLSGFVLADPSYPTTGSPTAVVQSDPGIYKELVQLCRVSPNEAGPFFTSP